MSIREEIEYSIPKPNVVEVEERLYEAPQLKTLIDETNRIRNSNPSLDSTTSIRDIEKIILQEVK